ncbi:hypothetical protein ACSBR2_006231 [Camellia fascicularis]
MKSFDEAMVASAVKKLEQVLEDAAISYHDLSGRHKSLYGIYVKMLKKKLTMDEIHDIHGLRLIIEKEEDCYKALRVVHQLWSEVPGKFKDYINQPKFNGLKFRFPSHSEDCPYSYKLNCVSDGPVFVIVTENDKMSVQEFPANSTILDLMERAGQGSFRWTSYGFPVKEELRPRLNHKPVSDPTCKIKMGDVVELTPVIPDKSLTEYREEIQRMYD